METEESCEWREYKCKSGETLFFYNQKTGEHRWPVLVDGKLHPGAAEPEELGNDEAMEINSGECSASPQCPNLERGTQTLGTVMETACVSRQTGISSREIGTQTESTGIPVEKADIGIQVKPDVMVKKKQYCSKGSGTDIQGVGANKTLRALFKSALSICNLNKPPDEQYHELENPESEGPEDTVFIVQGEISDVTLEFLAKGLQEFTNAGTFPDKNKEVMGTSGDLHENIEHEKNVNDPAELDSDVQCVSNAQYGTDGEEERIDDREESSDHEQLQNSLILDDIVDHEKTTNVTVKDSNAANETNITPEQEMRDITENFREHQFQDSLGIPRKLGGQEMANNEKAAVNDVITSTRFPHKALCLASGNENAQIALVMQEIDDPEKSTEHEQIQNYLVLDAIVDDKKNANISAKDSDAAYVNDSDDNKTTDQEMTDVAENFRGDQFQETQQCCQEVTNGGKDAVNEVISATGFPHKAHCLANGNEKAQNALVMQEIDDPTEREQLQNTLVLGAIVDDEKIANVTAKDSDAAYVNDSNNNTAEQYTTGETDNHLENKFQETQQGHQDSANDEKDTDSDAMTATGFPQNAHCLVDTNDKAHSTLVSHEIEDSQKRTEYEHMQNSLLLGEIVEKNTMTDIIENFQATQSRLDDIDIDDTVSNAATLDLGLRVDVESLESDVAVSEGLPQLERNDTQPVNNAAIENSRNVPKTSSMLKTVDHEQVFALAREHSYARRENTRSKVRRTPKRGREPQSRTKALSGLQGVNGTFQEAQSAMNGMSQEAQSGSQEKNGTFQEAQSAMNGMSQETQSGSQEKNGTFQEAHSAMNGMSQEAQSGSQEKNEAFQEAQSAMNGMSQEAQSGSQEKNEAFQEAHAELQDMNGSFLKARKSGSFRASEEWNNNAATECANESALASSTNTQENTDSGTAVSTAGHLAVGGSKGGRKQLFPDRATCSVKSDLPFDPNRPHRCTICNKTFKMKHHLTQHYIYHKGDRPYMCNQCGRTYMTSSNYNRHLKDNHTGKIYKRCPCCDEAFEKKFIYLCHLRTHIGEQPYRCDQCDKRYDRHRSLALHLMNHAGDKRHKCTFCGRAFLTSDSLAMHVRIHTNEKPYKCDFQDCQRTFPRRTSLVIHKRTHSDQRPYGCDQCSMKFKSKQSAKDHVVNKHSDLKPYDCEICGRCFKRRNALKIHLKAHKNKRTFTCKYCKACFRKRQGLVYHERLHEVEISETCTPTQNSTQ